MIASRCGLGVQPDGFFELTFRIGPLPLVIQKGIAERGVSLTFQSQVRNPRTLYPYSDAWGFIVSRKIGNGAWRSFFVSRWDEMTRSIKSSVVVNTSGCARHRVAAWSPRWWNSADSRKSAWSKVRGGALVGPTGVTCS